MKVFLVAKVFCVFFGWPANGFIKPIHHHHHGQTKLPLLHFSLDQLKQIINNDDGSSSSSTRPIAIAAATVTASTAEFARTLTYDDDVLNDFSTIAEAYRILSDPKDRLRYDRALQAKVVQRNIEHFVLDCITTVVVPFTRKAIGNIVIPFIEDIYNTLSLVWENIIVVATTNDVSVKMEEIQESDDSHNNNNNRMPSLDDAKASFLEIGDDDEGIILSAQQQQQQQHQLFSVSPSEPNPFWGIKNMFSRTKRIFVDELRNAKQLYQNVECALNI